VSTPGGQGRGLVLPAILMVLGLLVTAAVVEERSREERRPSEVEELAELIRRRRATIEDLSAELRGLSDRLAAAQVEQARGSEQVRRVVARVEALRAPAGLAPVRGPGIVVELTDSADAPRTRGELTDLRIQDVDLQLVANALWSAGAEALAVNGRRVTATTAIRQAGGRVLVNFDPVASPYRVAAIGDPDGLRRGLAGSEVARQFGLWREIYGLGFAVRAEDVVEIPALGPARSLSFARPASESAG
jgi:uncharacterized protein YlxW (UPF0749 family)